MESTIDSLLNHVKSLYNTEKGISAFIEQHMPEVMETGFHYCLDNEALENKQHCYRLEGILTIINRYLENGYAQKIDGGTQPKDFVQNTSAILKRVMAAHRLTGYNSLIRSASRTGNVNALSLLHNSLGIEEEKIALHCKAA